MKYFRGLTLDALVPVGEDGQRVVTWGECAERLEQEIVHYFPFMEPLDELRLKSGNDKKKYCLQLLERARDYERRLECMSIEGIITLYSKRKKSTLLMFPQNKRFPRQRLQFRFCRMTTPTGL